MKNFIMKKTLLFLFAFTLFSCDSNNIEDSVLTDFTKATYDTNSLLNIGYYHNIIVDSLNRFFTTIPSNQIESFIVNNEWVYSNVVIRAANILGNLPEFQNLEFDTLRCYTFIINFRDIILDTTGFFDENLLEFLHDIYPNDTLIHIVNQIMWCLTQPNRAELIDSLVIAIRNSDYSEILKRLTFIGCSIGSYSFDFWNRIIYSEIRFGKLINNQDKILVAPATVAIVGSDIIGGVASALTSSNSGWGYAKDIAIGAGAASAIAGLGSGAGKIAKFINKLKFWGKQ